MFLGDNPPNFALGRECRMQDASDVVDGMRLTHLGLVYDNIMSFVLDENGVLTKIRFLGMDDAADDDLEPVARLDAEFVLFTGTMRTLLEDLRKRLC